MRRAPSVPPDLPGYTFVRALGSGGFSDVYLYDQKLPRRRVAVKVLLTDELSNASRAAFVDEANLMAQLSAHPYIVTIFHADVASDDRPYFVMEYCAGPSLGESYKRGTGSVADALRTGVRLSSAIATAHGAGILHRDIKPANVLTNDYGWPALTDFGISSTVDDDLLPVHTGTLADALVEETTAGTSVGMSVPWSPPEMFEDDPQPDVRSDVFSLAATLYTVLAGRTPFEVRGRPNGTLDLIGRIERGALSPIDRDDLPRSLVAVLQKGMATDRADRFATAVDFARALQRVELELGYAPTSLDVPNLLVQEEQRDEQGDDDATRVRSVAVVDAQNTGSPALAPPTRAGTTPGTWADPDATLARSAARIDAQPVAADQTVIRSRVAPPPAASRQTDSPPAEPVRAEPVRAEPPPEPVPSTPMSRANRIAIIVAGAVAALIVIAAIIGIAVTGTGGSPEPPVDGESGDQEPAVVEGVPTPTLAADPVVDGSTVVFSVENPDPETDDTFRWIVSNLPDQQADTTTDGRIVVPDFTGQRICIDVWVVRDGRQSPDPLAACYPVAP